MRRAMGLAAALLALVAAACGRRVDPVRQCVDDIVAAANKRDAGAVMERVAGTFQAKNGTSRSEVEATLRRYFAAYESLDVHAEDMKIDRTDDSVFITLTAHLSGRPRAIGGLDAILPRESTYRFDFRLAPDGQTWRVVWADWAEEREVGNR
jgi:hypothetical protein